MKSICCLELFPALPFYEMVVVGWQYSESCTIEIIPQFLQIGGGVMLGFTILYLVCSVCGICCCGEEEGITNFRGAYIIG